MCSLKKKKLCNDSQSRATQNTQKLLLQQGLEWRAGEKSELGLKALTGLSLPVIKAQWKNCLLIQCCVTVSLGEDLLFIWYSAGLWGQSAASITVGKSVMKLQHINMQQ